MRIFMGKHPRMWVQLTYDNVWNFFLKSDSQGIWTKFLCHKIQHHLLNQKPYFSKKISTSKKVSSSESTLNIRNVLFWLIDIHQCPIVHQSPPGCMTTISSKTRKICSKRFLLVWDRFELQNLRRHSKKQKS